MPQFAPGEVKSARAPITVQPSGLSCSAELYLVSNGAKVATSGIKLFTSTGAKQDVSFPITMPGAEGTYPVYLDIFTNGLLVGAYKAVEDVVITTPTVPWAFSNVSCWPSGSAYGMWHQINFEATVTNIGNRTATRSLTQWRRDRKYTIINDYWGYKWFPWKVIKRVTVTLAPGQSYNYTSPENDLIEQKATAECYLVDSDGYESIKCQCSAGY
ncbi:hypothetical protein ES703_92884 [subsurface metagenome]